MISRTKLLGHRARDKVSGFTGTVTAQCCYIAGSDQVKVTQNVTAEGRVYSNWFDADRVHYLNDKKVWVSLKAIGRVLSKPKKKASAARMAA